MNNGSNGYNKYWKRYGWKNTNDQDEHNEYKRWITWGTHNLGDPIYKAEMCQEALTLGMRNEVSKVMNQKAKCAWLNWLAKGNFIHKGD